MLTLLTLSQIASVLPQIVFLGHKVALILPLIDSNLTQIVSAPHQVVSALRQVASVLPQVVLTVL